EEELVAAHLREPAPGEDRRDPKEDAVVRQDDAEPEDPEHDRSTRIPPAEKLRDARAARARRRDRGGEREERSPTRALDPSDDRVGLGRAALLRQETGGFGQRAAQVRDVEGGQRTHREAPPPAIALDGRSDRRGDPPRRRR